MRKFRKITAGLLSVIIVVTCLVTSVSAATETVSLTSGHAAATSYWITANQVYIDVTIPNNSGTNVRVQLQYMSNGIQTEYDAILGPGGWARGWSTYRDPSVSWRLILSPVPANNLNGRATGTITY